MSWKEIGDYVKTHRENSGMVNFGVTYTIEMKLYQNILVEIHDKHLHVKTPTVVFFHNDPHEYAGTIRRSEETEDGLYVDIESDKDLTGYYPSLSYKTIESDNDGNIIKGEVIYLSLSKHNPNVDDRIKPIS